MIHLSPKLQCQSIDRKFVISQLNYSTIKHSNLAKTPLNGFAKCCRRHLPLNTCLHRALTSALPTPEHRTQTSKQVHFIKVCPYHNDISTFESLRCTLPTKNNVAPTKSSYIHLYNGRKSLVF